MGDQIKRVAVVTGANRGLGFEASRQLGRRGYRVVLTSRDEAKGRAAVETLRAEGLDVVYHRLDVDDDQSIADFRQYLEREEGRADVLVNNAGVFLDAKPGNFGSSALLTNRDRLARTMNTNVFGPLLLAGALIPLMQKNGYGRVVNLSSGMGRLSDMSGGSPAYRISKTAVNAMTRVLAAEVGDGPVKVNSCSPGWVHTDMGGPAAPLTPEQGVDTVVWLATLPDDGPTGGFFANRERSAW